MTHWSDKFELLWFRKFILFNGLTFFIRLINNPALLYGVPAELVTIVNFSRSVGRLGHVVTIVTIITI